MSLVVVYVYMPEVKIRGSQIFVTLKWRHIFRKWKSYYRVHRSHHWWHEYTQAYAIYSLLSYINNYWNYISGSSSTLILDLKSFIVKQLMQLVDNQFQ